MGVNTTPRSGIDSIPREERTLSSRLDNVVLPEPESEATPAHGMQPIAGAGTGASLMVVAGLSAGKEIRLEELRTRIGRSRQAEVKLEDQGISRLHCSVRREGEGWFVEDLGSTNGTRVNGATVERAQLRDGDRIEVGSTAILQFVFVDESEGAQKKLYELATRDPLTRALNRQSFQERLSAEVSYALRHKEKLAAMVIDVDHFRSVNDSYGPGGGDAVLREIGALVRSSIRNEDVFGRCGGEEFVVLARGLATKHAVKMAERVRKTIEARIIFFEGQRLRVTISVGVADISERKDAAGDGMLRLADARLMTAKNAGRNRVVGA